MEILTIQGLKYLTFHTPFLKKLLGGCASAKKGIKPRQRTIWLSRHQTNSGKDGEKELGCASEAK